MLGINRQSVVQLLFLGSSQRERLELVRLVPAGTGLPQLGPEDPSVHGAMGALVSFHERQRQFQQIAIASPFSRANSMSIAPATKIYGFRLTA